MNPPRSTLALFATLMLIAHGSAQTAPAEPPIAVTPDNFVRAESDLYFSGVVKRFGGVQALRGVDFDLRRGEIHALLGENGAGKSTLMNILSGVVEPDAGEMRIEGAPVRFADPPFDHAMAE